MGTCRSVARVHADSGAPGVPFAPLYAVTLFFRHNTSVHPRRSVVSTGLRSCFEWRAQRAQTNTLSKELGAQEWPTGGWRGPRRPHPASRVLPPLPTSRCMSTGDWLPVIIGPCACQYIHTFPQSPRPPAHTAIIHKTRDFCIALRPIGDTVRTVPRRIVAKCRSGMRKTKIR